MNVSPVLQIREMDAAPLHAGTDARGECNTLPHRAVPQRNNQDIPDCKNLFYIMQPWLLQGISRAIGAQVH